MRKNHLYNNIYNYFLQIPCGFDFLKTFDMFFKCHKVFNVAYHSGIVKLMHFIDYYLYEDKENAEIDITVTMQKVSEKLNICDLSNDSDNSLSNEVQ